MASLSCARLLVTSYIQTYVFTYLPTYLPTYLTYLHTQIRSTYIHTYTFNLSYAGTLWKHVKTSTYFVLWMLCLQRQAGNCLRGSAGANHDWGDALAPIPTTQ